MIAATTTCSRLREIYAAGDISSPGLVLPQGTVERTGIGLAWDEELPAWEQSRLAPSRRPLDRSPAALVISRTGAAPIVVVTPGPVLIQRPRETALREPTVSVPRLIAHIRASLSLQIKQLAEVLGVERPTVYAWIKEQSEPRPLKRTKLQDLYRLAKGWDEHSNEPLGKALTEVAADGRAVFDILRQPEIPTAQVAERLAAIGRARGGRRASAPEKRRTLAQIAREIGVDMTRVGDQNDQIDVVTGKRISSD